MDENLGGQAYLKDMNVTVPPQILQSCPVQTLPKGTRLLQKGQAVEHVYYLCSGRVVVYDELPDGTQGRVVWVSPGETVGEMEALAGGILSIYSAKINEDGTKVIKIARDIFLEWVSVDNSFCLQMAVCLAKKLSTAAVALCQHMQGDALTLVLEYLKTIAGSQLRTREEAVVTPTRQEIADNCGISERTVNRCVRKLREQGLLSVKSGKIYIDKPQYNRILKKDQP